MVARATVHLARNCPQRDPPAHCCSVRQTRASKGARGSTPPPPTFIGLFAPFSSSSFLLFPLSTGPVPPSECPAPVFSNNYRTGLPPSIFQSATQTTQSHAVQLPRLSASLSRHFGRLASAPFRFPGWPGLLLLFPALLRVVASRCSLRRTCILLVWTRQRLMNYSCLPDPTLRWSSPARQHRGFF